MQSSIAKESFEELNPGKGTEPSANLRVRAGPLDGCKVAAEGQPRKMYLGPVTKNGQVVAVSAHGINSSPSRKLSALRRYFYFFPFFDEQGNADLQARLQPGRFGHGAARRVATNPGLG